MNIIHKPLNDLLVEANLFQKLASTTANTVNIDSWSNDEYVNCFVNWVNSSSSFNITGLDVFPYKAYCVGTTEGIQSFIQRHGHSRRLRFSKGEFAISKIICNYSKFNFSFLEDNELDSNDAVIISLPFSANGGIYPGYNDLIDQCNQLNIPVLLDLAYIGVSYGIDIDLTHQCITDVVFSLSKPMSAQLRLGLRIAKEYHDDVIQFNHEAKMFNRIAAKVGVELMNNFSQDYFVSKYRPIQEQICSILSLTPTNTLTLALGNEKNHKEFYRNGFYRICITDELLHRG